MAGRLALLTLVVVLVVTAPAAAQLPWPADDVDSRVRADGRGLDQAANLAYQRAKRPGDDLAWIDPFRRHWSGTRGERIAVRFLNRYGAQARRAPLPPEPPVDRPDHGRRSTGRSRRSCCLPGFGD